jgi:A/G-specific adenine glycosylase
MDFALTLIDWYNLNKRQLPWRETDDPYKIWLSEVIFQQTRIEQGLAYYHSFTGRFPTVQHLAQASEDEVMKLWQGLGYYSRARNLHTTAKTIVEKFNGRFPDNYADILALKGIGPYTAAAIASIAFNLPHAVVDGNVMRVISRWFAIDDAVNSTVGKKKIEIVVNELLATHTPGTFNQAMMKFGALFCKPKNPDCESCIFNTACLAFQKGSVGKLPFKIKNQPPKKRFFNYLLLISGKGAYQKVYLNKRVEGDIWQGLYDFPLIETETETEMDVLINSSVWKVVFKDTSPVIIQISRIFKHQLTHQQIFAKFITISTEKNLSETFNDFLYVNLKNLADYPVPRLIEQYLSENGFLN